MVSSFDERRKTITVPTSRRDTQVPQEHHSDDLGSIPKHHGTNPRKQNQRGKKQCEKRKVGIHQRRGRSDNTRAITLAPKSPGQSPTPPGPALEKHQVSTCLWNLPRLMSGNGFALCGREAGTVEGSDCEILFILLSSQVHTSLRLAAWSRSHS